MTLDKLLDFRPTVTTPSLRDRVTRERSSHGPGGWLIRVDGRPAMWRHEASDAETEMRRLRAELKAENDG